MADYIERQAALRAVNEFFHDPKVDIALNTVPAANVREVVFGEVVRVSEDAPMCWYGYCSICGDYIPNWNFCPNCGARMISK